MLKRKSASLLISILVAAISLCVNASTAVVRLVHTDRPIALTFKTNHEHRFMFPEAVNVDVPAQLTHVMHSLQPTAQAVYWTPASAFESMRVIARSLDNERVYLLDIRSTEDASAVDYRLENPVLVATTEGAASSDAGEIPSATINAKNPFPIELTRYVSQLLYAPARLQPKASGIRQLPVAATDLSVDLLSSQKGETYRYRLIGQWRGYGHHVTAMEVVNQSPVTVELDLRRVRGNWLAITAQHTWLGATNSLEDRTTLYLISKPPFKQALEELAYGF
ncbi:TIGR03749 family integrating conjugative element protein [Cellvibrio sp. ARAG 10.3]|uniref:TIGR03749 family integrating conjugative element protein n=1 Tax=Cellvibrio sp. ARAG 10.3 TaxID=3451358 RepID=UPI003F4481ED